MKKEYKGYSELEPKAVVIDIETTGLKASSGDELVNLAMVYIDENLDVVKATDYWVSPMNKLMPASLEHKLGLTNLEILMRSNRDTLLTHLDDMYEEIVDSTVKYDVIIQNPQFDATFLSDTFLQFGKQLPLYKEKCIDLRTIYGKYIDGGRSLDKMLSTLKIRSKDLEFVMDEHGIQGLGRHTGMFDCYAVVSVLSELCEYNSMDVSYGIVK